MAYADKNKAREYQKAYHLKTWAERKGRHQVLKRKRRDVLAFWLKTYKKELVCINCNENHPSCLDFHHKNAKEKENTIANMIGQGYSVDTIKREIDKCIVLCRNCHAKEHYNQNSSRV